MFIFLPRLLSRSPISNVMPLNVLLVCELCSQYCKYMFIVCLELWDMAQHILISDIMCLKRQCGCILLFWVYLRLLLHCSVESNFRLEHPHAGSDLNGPSALHWGPLPWGLSGQNTCTWAVLAWKLLRRGCILLFWVLIEMLRLLLRCLPVNSLFRSSHLGSLLS